MLKDKANNLLDYIKTHYPILKNKYVITIGLYLIWVGFFDENSLLSDIRYKMEIRDLQKKIEVHKESIADSKQKSNELKTSSEDLEKFAREQYKMKKAKEDIYVIE